MMQFVSACTLLAQWDKSGRDHMYVVRGHVAGQSHRRVADERVRPRLPALGGLRRRAWRGHENIRLPFRCIHAFACLRQLANAWSLLNQYHLIGDGVTPDNGHRQLWIRARIRLAGVPIQLARFVLKIVLLDDTRYERGDVEVACNFMRAVLLIPLSAWSLNHQYYTSGAILRLEACSAAVRVSSSIMWTTTWSGQGGLHRAKSNVGLGDVELTETTDGDDAVSSVTPRVASPARRETPSTRPRIPALTAARAGA